MSQLTVFFWQWRLADVISLAKLGITYGTNFKLDWLSYYTRDIAPKRLIIRVS